MDKRPIRMLCGLSKVCKSHIFFTLFVLGLALNAGHLYSIKELLRPAGIKEAVSFFINSPNEYMAALLFGSGAWVTSGVLIASLLSSLACTGFYDSFSIDFEDFESFIDTYNCGQAAEKVVTILKPILAIALFVLCMSFARYTGILAIVFLIILLFAYAIFADNGKR